jgi:FkbM family methyltransferase
MSLREGFALYHSLFGIAGVFLAARTRLFGSPAQVAVEVPGVLHPVHLRLRTTDVASCGEILIKRQYDWAFLRTPKIIVDAGANIGLASIFYANKYPSAQIIAIEPEASNYQMLVKNTAAYSTVKAVNAALWSENCELDIFDPEQGHTAFQMRGKTDSRATQRARILGITLDKLMSDFGISHIDLLKVDIEGAERQVFAQADRWIAGVDNIAIELHDWMLPGCDDAVQQAAKEFESKLKNGETTYLARERNRSPIALNSRAPEHAVGSKAPLKILFVT